MDINNIIDRLNNELEKLNNIKNSTHNQDNFFTTNDSFNDDLPLETLMNNDDNEVDSDQKDVKDDNLVIQNDYSDIEPDNETLSIVTLKEKRLLDVQIMFKKSIRVSLKSFLLSISLSFLNLFI